MKVAAIVPALNEEDSIGPVVAAVPRDLVSEVIVVDNGSADGTARVAQAAGARVVREERRGYGFACAAGVAAAEGFDVLVFLDGDGSDDPSLMGLILRPLEMDVADLVLGSRMLGSAAPGSLLPHQRLGNLLTASLIWLLYRQRISDVPPFRAVLRPVLAGLRMNEMTYGWPIEMVVKCARQRHRIVEVPVVARPRMGGKSKVSGTVKGTVLAAYYMLGTAVKYAWRD